MTNTELKSLQVKLDYQRTNTVLDNGDIAKLKLYKMLSKANCPKYLFEEIQSWGIQYGKDLSSSKSSKRSTFVNNLGKKIYGQSLYERMKPKIKQVLLP